MDNPAYLLALHSIDGLGPIRLKAILDYFKDPKLAWEADVKEIRGIGVPQSVVDLISETRKNLDPEEELEKLGRSGIKFMTFFDEDYPKLLKQIYDPPMVLYYKGEILPKDEHAIAVVGTRKMTGYGRIVTEQFVKDLVSAGLTVVSGLARGVDGLAHQKTLDNKGRTIAVLGSGLQNIFPPEHTLLADKICSGSGAVVSEFPPNYPSLPGNFPSRNRIIAGLSLAILVTEAAEDSGSLITARLGLEAGRDIFAVPGPITSSLSKGPIDLIKEGARVVFDPQEVLEEMGLIGVQNPEARLESLNNVTENERQVLTCLENENKHIDEICRELKSNAATVSATLLKMEISGLVQNLGSGTYCRRKG